MRLFKDPPSINGITLSVQDKCWLVPTARCAQSSCLIGRRHHIVQTLLPAKDINQRRGHLLFNCDGYCGKARACSPKL